MKLFMAALTLLGVFFGTSVRADSQSVLVVLKAQADLSGADSLGSRRDKARFVYEKLRDTVQASQPAFLGWLRGQGVSFHSFYLINAVSIDGASPSLLQALSTRDDVAFVAQNARVSLDLPRPSARARRQFTHPIGVEAGIARTGAPVAWSQFGARGQGVVIASNDTGVQWDHPALIAHYRGTQSGGVDHRYSWHDAIRAPLKPGTSSCGYGTTAPCDDVGHGTHTTGTLVGDDGQGNQVGMAPEAKWIGCRSMDRGSGTPATYLECFEYFLAPYAPGDDPLASAQPDLGADIVNNSWGCSDQEGCVPQVFGPALGALARAGMLVVAAAGNGGAACATASDEIARFGVPALAVGAFDFVQGKVADFSSRGPGLGGRTTPDLVAPGVGIVSSTDDGGYSSPGWDGTSMAAPHVAGAAALLLSVKPELSGHPDAIASHLEGAADPRADVAGCGGLATSAVPNNAAGYGELNVARAIATAFGM